MKNTSKKYSLSVIIERDQNGYYIGKVADLPSCYTQAKTLPELYKRLQEVVSLCQEMEKKLGLHFKSNEFVGIQKLDFVLN